MCQPKNGNEVNVSSEINSSLLVLSESTSGLNVAEGGKPSDINNSIAEKHKLGIQI